MAFDIGINSTTMQLPGESGTPVLQVAQNPTGLVTAITVDSTGAAGAPSRVLNIKHRLAGGFATPAAIGIGALVGFFAPDAGGTETEIVQLIANTTAIG